RPEQIVLERHARSPLCPVAIFLKIACATIDWLAAENKYSLHGEPQGSKSFAFAVISLSSVFPRNLTRRIVAMKRTKVAGAVLATAVALAFGASALNAGDTPSPSAQAAQIKCLGANACKGERA
ncbi:MAG: hypothetical protein ACLPWG_06095, partial [Steroidobacteraceae bacterium]